MSAPHFAQNLRLLAGHYRSIAEVCRRIGINRQQFNKYLSGASTPSVNTLRRICDFFGVEETEVFLPSREFAELVQIRRRAPSGSSVLAATIEAVAQQHPESQDRLRRYCGYYACYQYTPAYPSMIIKYLTVFFQAGDNTYGKSIERLLDKRNPERGGYVNKYTGLVLHSDDRIYLLENNPYANRQSHQVIALTVLYPSHRTHLHILSGLSLAVSGGPGRQAFATRIVYEYLGETINMRQAIADCALYPDDSDLIDDAIKSRIRCEMEPNLHTFCAAEF